MALYYYNKYTEVSGYEYSNETYQGQTNFTNPSTYTVRGVYSNQSSIGWVDSAGYYWEYGATPVNIVCPTNGTHIEINVLTSDTEKRIYILNYNSDLDWVFVAYSTYTLDKTAITYKGTFVETLIAENSTYPDDGSSGGYWYVKGVAYTTPTVTTSEDSLVTYNTARLNANLTDKGGEAALEVGFLWGETVTDHMVKVADQGTGAYYLDLTGLASITKYYFRAYATNSHETVYGSILNFTTPNKPLPIPTRNAPIADTETTVRKPWFDMTLTAEAGSAATKYGARVQIANFVSMTPVVTTLESKAGTGTWQVWDGVGDPTLDTSWGAMSTAGEDPGSRVRVKPIDDLAYRTDYYWNCTAWDGTTYGFTSNARKLRILITLDGLYLLEIAGVGYNILALSAAETSNGELGYINFVIDNDGGANNTTIQYGDAVILAIADSQGNKEEFTGKVRSKTPFGEDLEVRCILGDGILSDRICKQDYTSADIGATLASILATYCAPLTGTGIDTTTGFTAPVIANGKTPLSVIEALRRQYGFYYFVDKDWDTQLYLSTEITYAIINIKYGN